MFPDQCVCVFAWTEVNGHVVDTVDLFAVHGGRLHHLRPHLNYDKLASETCTALGYRYEGCIDADFSRFYRTRTFQQALAMHALLVDACKLVPPGESVALLEWTQP